MSGACGPGVWRKPRFGQTKPKRANEAEASERSQSAQTKPSRPNEPKAPERTQRRNMNDVNSSGPCDSRGQFWQNIPTGITGGISTDLGRRPRRGAVRAKQT